MQPVIYLKKYYVEAFNFHVLAEGDSEYSSPYVVPASELVFHIESGALEDQPDCFMVLLNCGLQDEPDPEIPYHFGITLTGLFEINGEFLAALKNPEEGSWIMLEAAMKELYAGAREFVAMNTARGPLPMLVLPTIDFAAAKDSMSIDRTDDEDTEIDDDDIDGLTPDLTSLSQRRSVKSKKTGGKATAKPGKQQQKKPSPKRQKK